MREHYLMYSWCRVAIFVVSVGSALCATTDPAVTRSLDCNGNCECTPYSGSDYEIRVISDGPSDYVDNSNCVYTMNSNYIMTLQFIMFSTEYRYDHVLIHKCTTQACTTASELLFDDGTTDLHAVYESDATHPVLRLIFTSDDSYTDAGWTAIWGLSTAIPVADPCAVTRGLACNGNCECTTYSGSDNAIKVISDGPSDYIDDQNCVYTMHSNYIMTLQFTMFATELFYDQVFIDKCTTQACTTASELFFGHGSTNLQAVYQSNATYPVLRLRFTSDEGNTGPGWAANWGLSTAIESTCRRVPTCVSGQYLNSNDACESCLANSNSPAGSTAITGCICNAGYTGADGGICLQCLGGTYKAGVGSAICTSCQANSFSPAGSIINTACRCNGGYTGANGSTCWQCLPGKFKSVY